MIRCLLILPSHASELLLDVVVGFLVVVDVDSSVFVEVVVEFIVVVFAVVVAEFFKSTS